MSTEEKKRGFLLSDLIEYVLLSRYLWVPNPNMKCLFSTENETGCSGLVHWDDPEGWDREEGGKGIQDGEHIYTHG